MPHTVQMDKTKTKLTRACVWLLTPRPMREKKNSAKNSTRATHQSKPQICSYTHTNEHTLFVCMFTNRVFASLEILQLETTCANTTTHTHTWHPYLYRATDCRPAHRLSVVACWHTPQTLVSFEMPCDRLSLLFDSFSCSSSPPSARLQKRLDIIYYSMWILAISDF